MLSALSRGFFGQGIVFRWNQKCNIQILQTAWASSRSKLGNPWPVLHQMLSIATIIIAAMNAACFFSIWLALWKLIPLVVVVSLSILLGTELVLSIVGMMYMHTALGASLGEVSSDQLDDAKQSAKLFFKTDIIFEFMTVITSWALLNYAPILSVGFEWMMYFIVVVTIFDIIVETAVIYCIDKFLRIRLNQTSLMEEGLQTDLPRKADPVNLPKSLNGGSLWDRDEKAVQTEMTGTRIDELLKFFLENANPPTILSPSEARASANLT